MQADNQQFDARAADGANTTAGGSANIMGDDAIDEATDLAAEVPFKGDELEEADFDDNTNISGGELDDDEGGLNADNPISKDALGDDDSTVADETASQVGRPEKSQVLPADEKEVPEQNSDQMAARQSSWKKRSIYLLSAVGLVVVAMVAYQYWSVAPQPKPIETVIKQPIKAAVAPIKLNAFIIPYHNGNYSYISLDVSLDVPAGPIRNEMITKLGLIRGHIYESLNRHIQEIKDVPAPDTVKAIVSKAVRSSVSKGEIGDLYLTQFLVI